MTNQEVVDLIQRILTEHKVGTSKYSEYDGVYLISDGTLQAIYEQILGI